jgi:hypothetical protein
VEDDLNSLRDKLAAATIELQQGIEVEMNREIEELAGEHESIMGVFEQEWTGEVEEAGGQFEEFRDVSPPLLFPLFCAGTDSSFFSSGTSRTESGIKKLRLNISEPEANTNDLHEKFEQALAHLEQESDEKDNEIVADNEGVQKLGIRSRAKMIN